MKIRLSFLSAASFFALFMLAAPTLPAQNKAPFTLADLSNIRELSSPAISPGGQWIAAELRQTDYARDSRHTELVLIAAGDGTMKSLAEGSEPQWAPDGKRLAYRGRAGGKSGLMIYNLASGDSEFLVEIYQTDHFLGHRARKNYAWSPDGRWIAYVGAEGPPVPKAEDEVRVYTRILYKTRTSFSDNRLTHLWVVDAAGGEPRLITPGPYNEHSLSWSPDSRRLAFISNHSEDPDNNHLNDLWAVDVASGHMARLTSTAGAEFQPAWAPDGRRIAYLANVRVRNTKDSPPENTQLYIIPAAGGAPENLTAALDRRVSDITWRGDSNYLYFRAGNHGKNVLYGVAVADKRIAPVVEGEFSISEYSAAAGGSTLAFVRSSTTQPAELWLAGADGKNARQLTHLNDDFMASVALQDAEMFWFESFDQQKVQGWLMKPANFQPGKKYPLILSVHGGPHGMYGYSFSTRFQALAGQGYGIVYINPRGSRGYGQAFADGCVMNWGGGDYQDLMAGVDFAVAHNEWIDTDRLGVMGGSYGGFMTNWIITQTNRFKAAVPMASLSNLLSFYGTSLYQLLIEVEFNGMPWDNYPLLWQWSPLAHITNVTTPTLLIHGEADHDVPVAQAEEMFIALKKRGIETVFVRYPGEGHGLRRPKNILDSMQRIQDWFDAHLKPGRSASAPGNPDRVRRGGHSMAPEADKHPPSIETNSSKQEETMSKNTFETSNQPGGPHHLLAQLAGTWEGPTRTWFEPGKLADESLWQGTIRPALDGRFVIHEYQGSLKGKPLSGFAIYGYHLLKERYESAWIDSFHMGTGIMFSSGEPHGQSISVLGHYGDPGGGPDWGWRTTIEILDADHVVITAYNITPAGEEAKAVETRYTRVP